MVDPSVIQAPMVDPATLALVVSGLSLAVAGSTLWLAHLRRGTLRMTRPRTIFFAKDGSERGSRRKVVVIALLYATAKRRLAVETMWTEVTFNGSVHVLSDWIYKDDGVSMTGGLNVGEEGRALYHHFFLNPFSPLFPWEAGEYHVKILAQIAGRKKPILLFESPVLRLEPEDVTALAPEGDFSFRWSVEVGHYLLADELARPLGPW